MASLKLTPSQGPVNLPALEEQVLAYWDSIHAFERSITERPESRPYVFYDGPPFVTGSPHYGSILGSVAKDVVPRYWTMKGYRVERQWGWDCHGLPIENMIEKDLGIKNGKRGIEELGIANFNNACRRAIAEFDATWEVMIRRIGRWVDFQNSYKTMDATFMESVWWAFKSLHEKGLVYEGRKVILYCPRCATPLSNFEIAMDNSYVDVQEWGTTYKFEVAPQTFILAWSTTPWTKIGTVGLAVHPELVYVAARQGEATYILAESRLSELHGEYEVTARWTGRELIAQYSHFTPHFDWAPLKENQRELAYRLVADEFVTADSGTGVVTLAVYGEDDYRVMQREHLPLYDYVDDQGHLDATIEEETWVGRSVFEVNEAIDEHLQDRGLIYKREPMTHSVATCYRCGTRLYYAPLPAWFVDIQKLKPDLVAQNEPINWYPTYLKEGRFGNGLKSAPDWNISRSRYWGTPMPVWQDASGKHQRIVGSVEELKHWAVNPSEVETLTDLHREFVDLIEVWVDDARTIKGTRIPEVFDCWVESGSMPFASQHYPFANKEQFEKAYPAQFISEYIAQTRAWFYTLHVLSVGLFGQPAFENVLTSGVIQAKDGSKMSKSKKNYTDPTILLDRDGADALRLYLMSSPVMKAENLAFTDSDIESIRKRVLNMWWNVFSFFRLYQPAEYAPAVPKPTHVMDRWILAMLEQTKATITDAMDHYDVTTASRSLMSFVDELSTWYLRQSRGRLREQNDPQAWHTFQFVLQQFALLAAPITPFLSEATYQNLFPETDSVHLADWPEAVPAFADEALVSEMAAIRKVVEETHAQRKAQQIKVRQPLAKVSVKSSQTQPSDEVLSVAARELNVKQVVWQTSADALLTVTLDTTLTPELQREGEARELIRQIQDLRKSSGVMVHDQVIVTLPSWPAEFEAEIKEKTKAVELKQGEVASVHRIGSQ